MPKSFGWLQYLVSLIELCASITVRCGIIVDTSMLVFLNRNVNWEAKKLIIKTNFICDISSNKTEGC